MRRAAVLAAALLVLVALPVVARADVSSQEAVAIAKGQPDGKTLLLSHPDARFTRAARGGELARARAAGASRRAARELGDRPRERARS